VNQVSGQKDDRGDCEVALEDVLRLQQRLAVAREQEEDDVRNDGHERHDDDR
jgi:hypothetical protein